VAAAQVSIFVKPAITDCQVSLKHPRPGNGENGRPVRLAMKNYIFLRRFALAAVSIACLHGVKAFAQTTTPSTVTHTFSTPPMGLASSETAQVNLVNTAAASSTGTAASCTGSISFVSSTGATIGSATNFTITTGQIFSASLPFTRVGATGVRTEVRAVVTLTESTTARTPCALGSSFETYDTTSGVTHVYQSEGLGGFGGGGRGDLRE